MNPIDLGQPLGRHPRAAARDHSHGLVAHRAARGELAPRDRAGQPAGGMALASGADRVRCRLGGPVDGSGDARRSAADGGAGPVPLRRGGPRAPVGRRHRPPVPRLPGAGTAARAGVLPPGPARHRGHDVPGRSGGPDRPLPRTRGHVGRGVRPGRLQPRRSVLLRGGAQVLPHRRVRLRVPAVRHRPGLRGRGDDESVPHRGAARRSA